MHAVMTFALLDAVADPRGGAHPAPPTLIFGRVKLFKIFIICQ